MGFFFRRSRPSVAGVVVPGAVVAGTVLFLFSPIGGGERSEEASLFAAKDDKAWEALVLGWLR